MRNTGRKRPLELKDNAGAEDAGSASETKKRDAAKRSLNIAASNERRE
jgi:hypothetical protein